MKSVIIGAGTYGQVYLSYLQNAGINIVGFIDDNKQLWNTDVLGIPVLGGREILPSLKEKFGVDAVYCPIGNNQIRVELLQEAKNLGLKTPSYIDKSACVSPDAKIGEGVYITYRATVMPFAVIDNYVMLSMSCNVAHHSHLSKGTFISTGVNFGALIETGENAYIGIGATVMTGVKNIGKNALIGAGSVVIRDVPDNAVVAGVPAKVIKYK